MSGLGFKARIPCFRASLPAYKRFLRVTSGATPADLLAASMAAKPFHTRTCVQALVGLESGKECGIIRASNTLRAATETFNPNTLCPAYNEFGYNEHPAKTSRFLCIKITKMLKICLQQAPICYEHLRLHLFTFCKRDQVYSL